MSTPRSGPPREHPPLRALVLAAALDVAAVTVLVLVDPVADRSAPLAARALGSVWPFLVALAVAWGVARAWRRPAALWSTGVAVWAITWALGVVLRVVASQGPVPAFHLVSLGVLALTLLGWRAAVALRDVLAPPGRRRRAAWLAGRGHPDG